MNNNLVSNKTLGPLAIQHQNLLEATLKIESLCRDIEIKLCAISAHPVRVEKIKESDPCDPLQKDLVYELASISERLDNAAEVLRFFDNKLGGLF